MRKPALALIPAASLLLLGATGPSNPTALAECRLTHDEVSAGLKDLAVEAPYGTPDRNRYYSTPKDLTVFGFPARSLASYEASRDGMEALAIMTIASAPYDQLVATALKQHGLTECEGSNNDGVATCVAMVRREGDWNVGLMFKQVGSETAMSCGYLRKR